MDNSQSMPEHNMRIKEHCMWVKKSCDDSVTKKKSATMHNLEIFWLFKKLAFFLKKFSASGQNQRDEHD